MYKHNAKQLEFEQFSLPFNGGLRSDNRWIKITKFIPWEEFEILYSKSLAGSQMGSPAQIQSSIIINNLEVFNKFSSEMHFAPLCEYPHQMHARIIRAPIFIIQKHIVVVGMVARR